MKVFYNSIKYSIYRLLKSVFLFNNSFTLRNNSCTVANVKGNNNVIIQSINKPSKEEFDKRYGIETYPENYEFIENYFVPRSHIEAYLVVNISNSDLDKANEYSKSIIQDYGDCDFLSHVSKYSIEEFLKDRVLELFKRKMMIEDSMVGNRIYEKYRFDIYKRKLA